jgi:hypothetical protein
MAFFRLLLSCAVGGALVGVLAVSLVGPKYIAWDNTPGSGTSAMCLCQEVARQGADRIIAYQMTGAAAGALTGAAVAVAIATLRRKKSPVA